MNLTTKILMTCNLRSMMKQLTRSSMSTTVIHYPTRNIMRMTMKKRQKHMMMWRLRKRLKKTLYMMRKKEMKIMMKLKQRQKLRGTSVCTVDTNCPILF